MAVGWAGCHCVSVPLLCCFREDAMGPICGVMEFGSKQIIMLRNVPAPGEVLGKNNNFLHGAFQGLEATQAKYPISLKIRLNRENKP